MRTALPQACRPYVRPWLRLALAVLVIPAAGAFQTVPQPLSGVWETVRVNRQALPMTDQVTGADGYTNAVRFQGMIIRMRPNGRFSAALQYRRAILSKGEQIERVPLQNDTWVGVYTAEGTHIRFVPEARSQQQRVQPFDGQIAGRRITVSFDYEIVGRKRYVLDMDRNDNIY
jgi:hypothetical protein